VIWRKAYPGSGLRRINFGYTQAERWRERPQRAKVEMMSLSDELLTLSSVEMRRRIGTKEISPVELLEASIARIEALNPAVNAIAATDFAHARKLAMGAESAARKGEQLGPLHGLPTGIKDLHETAGLLTTYGSPLYRSHVPAHDAAMVSLVRKAGAIILCKTNVPDLEPARIRATSCGARPEIPLTRGSMPVARWAPTFAPITKCRST
jgi:Asp-tRNA(Asn)/Glu-tRNA(Gln) amidotransferase A subunit family amidase